MLVGAYPFEDPEDPKNFRKTLQVCCFGNLILSMIFHSVLVLTLVSYSRITADSQCPLFDSRLRSHFPGM